MHIIDEVANLVVEGESEANAYSYKARTVGDVPLLSQGLEAAFGGESCDDYE